MLSVDILPASLFILNRIYIFLYIDYFFNIIFSRYALYLFNIYDYFAKKYILKL
jgi:hypothetical protein